MSVILLPYPADQEGQAGNRRYFWQTCLQWCDDRGCSFWGLAHNPTEFIWSLTLHLCVKSGDFSVTGFKLVAEDLMYEWQGIRSLFDTGLSIGFNS